MTIHDAVFADLEAELKTTRRLLERLPNEHLAWRPHERSFTLGDLAAHIINLLYWQTGTLTQDEVDLKEALAEKTPPVASREDAVERFDALAASLREAVTLDDEALAATWTLRHGDTVLGRQPRARAFRTMGLSHLIHHRGQLSVYLRLLNVPLPPMYGPTADEGR